MSETKKLKFDGDDKILSVGLYNIAGNGLYYRNTEVLFALKHMRHEARCWKFSLWFRCDDLIEKNTGESLYLFPYELITEKMTRLVPPENWNFDILNECFIRYKKHVRDIDDSVFWTIFRDISPSCQNDYLYRTLWTYIKQFLPFPRFVSDAYQVFTNASNSWLAQTLLDIYPDYFDQISEIDIDYCHSHNEVAQMWTLERRPETKDKYAGIPASRAVWKLTMTLGADISNPEYLNVSGLRYQLETGIRPKSWTDKKLCEIIRLIVYKSTWIECFQLLDYYGIKIDCASMWEDSNSQYWLCALMSFGYYTGPISQVKDQYLLWSNALSKKHFSPEAKQVAKTALLVLVRMGLGMGFRYLRESIVTRVMNAYVEHLRWLKWGDVDCRF